MLVRVAVPADLDALIALYVQLAPGNVGTTHDAAARALGATLANPDLRLFVVDEGGAVIGTVLGAVLPGLTHGGRSWMQIENMVVDEARRGSGIGRALIDACVDFARERDCYKVQLQSDEQREGAHRFYERAGFLPSSVGFRRYFE